jgi:hypothetical protein
MLILVPTCSMLPPSTQTFLSSFLSHGVLGELAFDIIINF